MVGNVTSLTGNGLRDWLVQRITAIILAVYVLWLVSYVVLYSPMTYRVWLSLFSQTSVKLFTILALFSLVLHAWVGIWTITTDYIKFTGVRVFVQILVIIALLTCVLWGIHILWGV